MNIRILAILGAMCTFVFGATARADDVVDAVTTTPSQPDSYAIFNHPADNTPCAAAAFADALHAASANVSETDSEQDIRTWIYSVFSDADVLGRVLECPEIASADDTASIKFMPIEYVFPGGRKITVNYETQPKILRQRVSLKSRRALPTSNPNPRLGLDDDGTIWTNTDPAWYAVMVVESGALSEFVGPNRNNTISLDYIRDNIDRLYPSGFHCTSKSALANDSDIINTAVHNTVSIADDTNDYYVAGDVNLQWISYAEIALDVVITVATMGGGTVISGITKSARASRTMKNMATKMRALAKLDSVRDYVRASQKYSRAAEELKAIDRAKDAATYAKKSSEIDDMARALRNMERADDNVRQYKQMAESFAELNKYRHALRGVKMVRRGNVISRTWKASKAALTGNKAIARGARLARSGTLSNRVRDWLFDSTLHAAGSLAKAEAAGGLLYGTLKFVGDMYDWTETSTGEFTNNIEFAPLLLLSADDLQGQENVVNHGMWLMWAGNSTDPADDDAAYLSAMDFAAKFHQDLTEIQESQNTHACNVDIYVVRPIIRNPGTDAAALYYLVMNDVPWTTTQ